MKTGTVLIVCLTLLPFGRMVAEDAKDDEDPFVKYNASIDPKASAAFSDAVERHAAGAAMPAEMAAAQARLSRRLVMISAEASEQIKRGPAAEATRSVKDSPENRTVAQNLDRDISGIKATPGPREYQELTDSLEKAGNAMNAGNAARSLNREAIVIGAEVRQAVNEELVDTIETLEESSTPMPGSEAPK